MYQYSFPCSSYNISFTGKRSLDISFNTEIQIAQCRNSNYKVISFKLPAICSLVIWVFTNDNKLTNKQFNINLLVACAAV